MSEISVVIINYNCGRFIEDCINSLLSQAEKPAEILIIDNASTDGSRDILLKKYSSLPLELNTENTGFSKAVNQGIKKAKGKFVLILNADALLHRDFLKTCGERIKNIDGSTGIITGLILRLNNEKTVDSAGQFISRFLKPKERDYGREYKGNYTEGYVFSACGAAALYRKEMLEEVKINGEYFDEDLYMYFEDFDLGWRANIKGWKTLFIPGAVAYHFRGGAAGRNTGMFQYMNKPAELRARIFMNRYLVLLKNCPLRAFLRRLPFLFFYDLAALIYVIIFDTLAFIKALSLLGNVKKMLQKRKVIFAGRKPPGGEIEKWIL